MNYLMIFLGGGCGSVLRYVVGLALPSSCFPWATLAVNLVGSFAIGLFGGWASRFGWNDGLRLAMTVGLCGGFTTFSTFSKESFALAESGRWSVFAIYMFGSILLGLAAVVAGYCLSKQ